MIVSDHPIRLGFHYHIPAEQREHALWMPGYLGRFVDSLAEQCNQVVLFLHEPRVGERLYMDYRLRSSNVSLHSLGPRRSAWQRGLFPGRFRRILARHAGEIDVLLLRGPSPLLPALAAEAHLRRIPTVLLLVGSTTEGINDLPQPRWRKELIRMYSHWNQRQQDRTSTRSLTFVNSRKLYERYEGAVTNLVETRTSTLNENDYFQRIDTCQGNFLRLLYTGRFDRGKGLLEMVQAMALLRAQGFNLVLDLVGWDSSGTDVEADIAECARRSGVGEYVLNHGRKTLGPELFEYYRQADVYVIASRLSEGFPRTIWEAMAHCVPVVATRVGSIPQFIEGAAVLVNPGSAAEIARGIELVIASPDRRREMIAKGYELARENTLERRAKEMMDSIRLWLQEGGR